MKTLNETNSITQILYESMFVNLSTLDGALCIQFKFCTFMIKRIKILN